MKKRVALTIFIALGILVFTLSHCGGRISNAVNYRAASAPGNIFVTNGQTIGFFTPSGDEKNILSLNGMTGTQNFAQNSLNGLIYYGVNSSGRTPSNSVIYLNGLRGNFTYSTLAASQIVLGSGTSGGVAASSLTNLVYAADSVNDVITYLNAGSLSYAIGGNSGNSIFAAPAGFGANYINVTGSMVIVTETQMGGAYFMDANNGNPIIAAGGKIYLPLVSSAAGCTSAGFVNEVQVNPGQNIAFVLCGASVVYINMNVKPPNYLMSNIASSTFSTTGVSAPKDMAYDSVDNTVIVVGGATVISLNARTGALINSVDLSTYKCGSGINLQGVAYSFSTKQIYVTDTSNSSVYTLNGSSFALGTGECDTSVFSTATDVPKPTKIGYF